MIKAQKRWAQRRTLEWTFKIGDQVWLEGWNLHLDCLSIKLSPKRHGPFKIKKVLSPIMYQLDLPIQWKIHDVFHIDLLTPYQEMDFNGPNFVPPPPNLIDGEEEYEIEEILDARWHRRGCKIQYLVKWKGYPESDNQWVNWDDLHTEGALEDFKKKQPNAPIHIRGANQEDERTGLPMTSNANSTTSFAPSQEGLRLPPEIAEAFLSWQPNEPSSWTTPPGTEGANTPNLPCSNDSSPIRWDYYVPQMLICTWTICTTMQHTLPTPPPPPWTPRTPTATPQPTPSPAPHQSSSPTPTPVPSPSCCTQQVSTLWDHYIQTQGFWIHDPLSPAPCCHIKKPKKYRLTPEERFHQEQLALMMRPMHGRMLTRGLLGKIMDSHHPHQRASSWMMVQTTSPLTSIYLEASWSLPSMSRSNGAKIPSFMGWLMETPISMLSHSKPLPCHPPVPSVLTLWLRSISEMEKNDR